MLNEHTEKIGTIITVRLGKLWVDVKILDVRPSFGRVDYQITPVKGSGTVWIEAPKGE